MLNFRYPTREIVVAFVWEVDDYYSEIAKVESLINKTKGDGSTVKLIFKDDLTAYYEGFYAGWSQANEVAWDGHKYCITGRLTFVCPYPHRRSVIDKAFEMSVITSDNVTYQEVEIINNGSLSAPVSFTINTPKTNLSFVSLIGSKQAYEIGNSSDSETTYEQSTLVMSYDDLIAADNSTENYLWNLLNLRSEYWHTGVWGTYTYDGKTLLHMATSGIENAKTLGRYGNCKEFTFSSELENFTMDANLWIQQSKIYQEGYLGFSFLDANNNVIFGVEIFDGSFSAGDTIWLRWYVGGELIDTYKTIKKHGGDDSAFTWPNGVFYMKRESYTKFSLYFGRGSKGTWRSTVNTSLKNTTITKMQVFSYQWYTGSQAIEFWTRRAIVSFSVYKLVGVSASKIYDRFKAGDEIDINAEDSVISINGAKRNDVEVLGSQIIMAPPGKSTIRAMYQPNNSDTDPTIIAKITERWY